MGVLGFPTQDDFDKFKNEIFSQIRDISDNLTRTANESAELADEAVKRITSIETEGKDSAERLKQILVAAELLDNQASGYSTELKQELDELRRINKEISEKAESATQELHFFSQAKIEIDKAASDVQDKVSEINSYVEQSEGFPDAINQLSNHLGNVEENAEKINSLLVHSAKRKGEIDDLYKKIYGEDIKSDSNDIEHTDGIIDKLNRSYDAISEKIDTLEKKADSNINELTIIFEKKLNEQIGAFDDLVRDSQERIGNINTELKNLLPGAMAAGLSAAYENKTTEEIKSLRSFTETFKWAIFGLVCISLIPFAVDIYLLGWQSKDLVVVIKDTPSLIVSILPLYFPVLWLAHSSNKKINLSKRLIEEYTHKAVLGKTFSGLSNQIDNLANEDAIKGELRTRLLFNVLQVSAENPGKLISNYQKSDHPLMEALENSAKLSDSVDVLAKIPGFGALAKKLAERGEDLIGAQVKKVEQGLQAHEVLEAKVND